MPTEWLSWSETRWGQESESYTDLIQFADRLLQATWELKSFQDYARTYLSEIATLFSAQWAGIFKRTPEWNLSQSCGQFSGNDWPYPLLSEALDKEACGLSNFDHPTGWSGIVIPFFEESNRNSLLLLMGRNVNRDSFLPAVGIGKLFDFCLHSMHRHEQTEHHVKRLGSILGIASTFAGARETQPLLELIAQEATRLMNCDRASIFLWDKEHNELVACPALGVEENSLRLPDDVGIVGEVIHHEKLIRVDDAYNDRRFNQEVDKASGYKTNTLLCAPLYDGEGNIVGAFEVINKNEGLFNENDEETIHQLGLQVAIAIQNTREREELIRSREHLTEQLTQGVRIIGESPAIQALRTTIDRVASTDLPVLIMGESGTGKEVVSQALHYQGPRAGHPFIAVNCAALTETLLESELFGHEKGAFTDAHEMRRGKFEAAEGGTLFLDEMGEMSAGGQAKLLRVLEQKVITRVGGSQAIPINVRVIAATNVNLVEAVRQRKFREDLYYRLSVVTLQLPSLRDRPEDILPLAEYFLKSFCHQANRKSLTLSSEARRRIQAHSWPGNVRELRNLMERVAFLAQNDRVDVDDLAFILAPEQAATSEMPLDLGLKEATEEFQRDYIRRAIKRVKGNMSDAAKLLDLHRSNLYRKMRQLTMEEAGGES